MHLYNADPTSAAGRAPSVVTTTRALQGREEDGATGGTFHALSDGMAPTRYKMPSWGGAYEWALWAGRRFHVMIAQRPQIASEIAAMLFASPLAHLLSLTPLLQIASTIPFLGHGDIKPCKRQPPAFFLAGDSTTAIQSSDGGGWGLGFLSTLESPAWGIDYGHNGATTVSFVAGGIWSDVIDSVQDSSEDYDVLVTIQVSASVTRNLGS